MLACIFCHVVIAGESGSIHGRDASPQETMPGRLASASKKRGDARRLRVHARGCVLTKCGANGVRARGRGWLRCEVNGFQDGCAREVLEIEVTTTSDLAHVRGSSGERMRASGLDATKFVSLIRGGDTCGLDEIFATPAHTVNDTARRSGNHNRDDVEEPEASRRCT